MTTTFSDKATTSLEDVRSRVGESLEVSNLGDDTTQLGYDQNKQATTTIVNISPTATDVDDDLDEPDVEPDVTIVNG